MLHRKRIYVQENDSSSFKYNVKVFRNSPNSIKGMGNGENLFTWLTVLYLNDTIYLQIKEIDIEHN